MYINHREMIQNQNLITRTLAFKKYVEFFLIHFAQQIHGSIITCILCGLKEKVFLTFFVLAPFLV